MTESNMWVNQTAKCLEHNEYLIYGKLIINTIIIITLPVSNLMLVFISLKNTQFR